MEILFLSRWFPYPADNGSKIRIYNLLQGLAQDHAVTLISFSEGDTAAPYPEELTRLCKRILVIPWKEFDPHSLRARLGFFSLIPRSARETFSSEMAVAIKREIGRGNFKCIIASQWQMATYGPYMGKIPVVFEEVELGVYYDPYRHAPSFLSKIRSGLTWFKHRRYLAQLASCFKGATLTSDKEREMLTNLIPTFQKIPIKVIENGVDVSGYRPANGAFQETNHSLIFTGPFGYRVNYEAMVWFLNEVYHLIQQEIPDVTLKITGDHRDLPLPEAPGVTLTGYVNDIQGLIAGSAVSIAPLLSGGGTRLKILEAFALKTPVVATSKGAEGLNATSGVHLLIADTPEAFAAAVVQLLTDAEYRTCLTESAYQLVCEQYDWSKILPKFVGFVEDVGQQVA